MPFPSEDWETSGDDTVEWSVALGSFQFFQGVVQTLDLVLDGAIDVSALSIDPDTGEKTVKTSSLMEVGFAWAHLFAYVIGDAPYFWGYPPSATEPARFLPYVRYGFTFWFNMADLLVAIRMGMMVRAYDPEPGADPWQAFYASLCTTLAGWMRLGAQFWEFSLIPDVKGRDANWYEIWNYWINITAYIQTATGFVRYAYTKFPGNAPLAVALIAKTAVDTIGDLFSGVSTCVQPAMELANPPKIQIERPPNGQPVMLPVGTQWQPYEMDYITVEGGFPTYSWTTAGTDDPDSPPSGLQDGLYLETADEGAYGSKRVRVAGWLDDIRAAHGQLLMQDNYGPALTDSFTLLHRRQRQPQRSPAIDVHLRPDIRLRTADRAVPRHRRRAGRVVLGLRRRRDVFGPEPRPRVRGRRTLHRDPSGLLQPADPGDRRGPRRSSWRSRLRPPRDRGRPAAFPGRRH